MTRCTLVLLYGGKSGEHEVSLSSAATILHALDRDKYDVIPMAIDKDGKIYKNDFAELISGDKALPVKTKNSILLDSLISKGKFVIPADIVFPAVHGSSCEDGVLQGVLESANIAYVGCNVLSSAIGMDKDICRRLVNLINIPSASYRLFQWQSREHTAFFCRGLPEILGGWPLIVKPCSSGSSVGIHKVHNLDELLMAVDDARRFDTQILVESFICGREIEIAVLEDESNHQEPKVSLPGEIVMQNKNDFYSYSAKYLNASSALLYAPASLDLGLQEKLQNMAKAIFVQTKCHGMARVDFFVENKSQAVYFNEINTLPGFTSISMYPKLWEATGISISELLDNLIALGLSRFKKQQLLVSHYQ